MKYLSIDQKKKKRIKNDEVNENINDYIKSKFYKMAVYNYFENSKTKSYKFNLATNIYVAVQIYGYLQSLFLSVSLRGRGDKIR